MSILICEYDDLESIADEIRNQNGSTEKMSITEMKTNMEENNADIVISADLIAQIEEALVGKAAGGGSAELIAFGFKGSALGHYGNCYANKDMTWNDFLQSDYNKYYNFSNNTWTSPAFIQFNDLGTTVIQLNGYVFYYLTTEGSTLVSLNDVIISDHIYTLKEYD